jgi:AraC-like DNA-binding protein
MKTLAPSGPITVERVSKALGMSCRTLQRRLSEHDLTFRDVLARVRLEMAQKLLRQTDLPMLEIADRLGYQKPGAFSRAFAQWTDQLPSEYRKRERG